MKSALAGNTWGEDFRRRIVRSPYATRFASSRLDALRRPPTVARDAFASASETYSRLPYAKTFRPRLNLNLKLTRLTRIKNGRGKNKTPRDRDLLGFRRHCWRRRRDSNPRSRFWPRCSLSRGVPSTSRPRLPNFRSRRESARRSQDNSGPNREGQCLWHIFCARFLIVDAICSHTPQRRHEAAPEAQTGRCRAHR